MGLLLIFLSVLLTVSTFIKLINNILKSKNYIIKRAKVVGFESFVSIDRDSNLNILYNPALYPVLEVEDKDEKIKLVMPVYENNIDYKEGKEIEIMYPKGRIEKSKIYDYHDELKFYYVILTIGLIIVALSFNLI